MALGLIVLGLYYGFSGTQQGIGHFAHIGGAILGFLMVRFWKMQKKKKKNIDLCLSLSLRM